jgi:hypothetical protein
VKKILDENNSVAKVVKSFDYRIETAEVVKKEGKLRVPNERTEVMASIFYSWKEVHSFATSKSAEYGGMEETDMIVKLRPDIRFLHSFDPLPLAAYLKLHPNTVFGYYPHDTDSYRSTQLSDNFWITTKMVLDKFSQQLDVFGFALNETIGRDPFQMEYYWHRVLRQLNVKIEFLPSGFRINLGNRLQWPREPTLLSYPHHLPQAATKDILPPHLLRDLCFQKIANYTKD